MKRKQIRLAEQQIEKLDKEQDRTGYSHSEIIRRALDEYFERRERE